MISLNESSIFCLNQVQILFAALTISPNYGLSDAPPTKRPSTDVIERYSWAFLPLALPP